MRWMLPALIMLTCGACDACASKPAPNRSAPPPIDSVTRNPPPKEGGPIQLETLRLPEGFTIEVFSDRVPNARSLAIAPDGTVFVGTRRLDRVYALRDLDGDHRAEKVYVVAKGLEMPNGVAFRDGALFISEVNRILRIDDVLAKLETPSKPVVVTARFPKDHGHGWKRIAFGPDGLLYVPVGAPCDVCDPPEPIYGSITRLRPDGKGLEIFAHGVRNTVGFDWHPTTQELWFTENGRDGLGDDVPPDELNRAPQAGLHFGFPYCHGGDLADPEHGAKRACSDFVAPARKLGAHVAALGMRFYTGTAFPADYHHQIFIAEHGSWNRSKKSGYRVMRVKLEGREAITYEPFVTGWLNEETDIPWGRPVDVAVTSDGALLVSDDYAGAVYRVAYQGT